jgi:hypothetical protein
MAPAFSDRITVGPVRQGQGAGNMTCNIDTRAEHRIDGKWRVIPGLKFFRRSHYGVYGFLADVRNYSAIPPISEQRGIPADAPVGVDIGDHSFSWLSIDELLAFNYDATSEIAAGIVAVRASWEIQELTIKNRCTVFNQRKDWLTIVNVAKHDGIAMTANIIGAIDEHCCARFGAKNKASFIRRLRRLARQVGDDNSANASASCGGCE